MKMTLDSLPISQIAMITGIDWPRLGEREGRRMRELGFETGEMVEIIHGSGWFSRDPIACRIGRMTVAIRKAHAASISVEPST
jgi:ferrous iron transport protein A